MPTRTWIVAFVTLVFLTRVSAGVPLARTALSLRPGPPPGGGGGGRGGSIGLYGPLGPPPERYVSHLARQLDLDEAQRERILAILDEQRPRIEALQEAAREQFVTEQQALFTAIADELTPDQQTRFATLTERQRTGGDRGGRGGGRDGRRRGGGGGSPRGGGPGGGSE
jgi:Spy/CpxP family protein refolding chaperone